MDGVRWLTVRRHGSVPDPTIGDWARRFNRTVDANFERPDLPADAPWSDWRALQASITDCAIGRCAGLVFARRSDFPPHVLRALDANARAHRFVVEFAADVEDLARDLDRGDALMQRQNSSLARQEAERLPAGREPVGRW